MGRLWAGLVSNVWVLVLLVGVFGVVLNVPVVRGSGITYIRADGSIDPPGAPISSVDNITYTLTDNINDSVVIERDNIVVNGAGRIITGSGGGNGITLTSRSNVTVRNMTIKNFYNGTYLDSSSGNTLCGNNVTANHQYGIVLSSSSNNTLSGNNVTTNNVELSPGGNYSADAIWLNSSSNNTLYGNSVSANNGYGIVLDSSSDDNVLSDNNVTANIQDGISLYSSSDNVLSGNNVANNWGGIVLSSSSTNTLSNNSIAYDNDGIWLSSSSDDNVLSGNDVTANSHDGIVLDSSSDNVLSGNSVTANRYWGIWLSSSSNNTLSGNVMGGNLYNFGVDGSALSHYLNSIDASNLVDGKPVYYFVNQSSIVVNADTYPEVGYLAFVNCANVTAQGLNLTNNGQGLLLEFTNDSKIIGNNITNNYDGIVLCSSYDNVLFHNTLWSYGLGFRARTDGSSNIWDDGYPSGGNYWSRSWPYNEVDRPYNAVDSNGDGIGDTPYVIDANNTDRYPLMAPYSMFDAGTWNGTVCSVGVMSNSAVSEFKVNVAQKTIGFNFTGAEGSTDFYRVTIPNIIVQNLWQGNYTILVDGKPWSFRNWTDTTNIYLYFNYTHSQHQTVIIPELPSLIILPILMIVTLLAIIVSRRKWSRHQTGS